MSTVPAVPNDAIVTYQGQDFIFMMYEREKNDSTNEITFERIPVAKGTSDVGYTEITLLKEIPKDAKIVLTGAYFILAKMTNIEHEE